MFLATYLQFEWPNMQMYCFRLKLAALHFNENSNCPQATTKQGVEQYEVVQPK